MADLSISNTLRNMKFMQRTSDSRKKSLKKSIPLVETTTIPEHPGCWRIVGNVPEISANDSHPSIIQRPSVFAVHDRCYSRLSFQHFNKRLEPLMMKYGLQQELKHLEDGEIDPNDEEKDEEKEEEEDAEPKATTTLAKTIGKKFTKKSFSRVQFDSRSRVTKKSKRSKLRR